jgi:hypothetical protein
MVMVIPFSILLFTIHWYRIRWLPLIWYYTVIISILEDVSMEKMVKKKRGNRTTLYVISSTSTQEKNTIKALIFPLL